MFDKKYFFIQAKMTKSSQKKGQNYIPFLQSTYPEMQRKTSYRQSGACAPGPRWVGWLRPRAACASPAPSGRGGSSRMPEQRPCPQPLVGRGLRLRIRAARVPPVPGWQGVVRPCARAAHVPLALGYLLLNLHILKCKENIYLE